VLLLWIFLCHFPVFLPGLEPMKTPGSFQYNVWTNDNGLPVNTVMAISQTPDVTSGSERKRDWYGSMGFASIFQPREDPLSSVIKALYITGKKRGSSRG